MDKGLIKSLGKPDEEGKNSDIMINLFIVDCKWN